MQKILRINYTNHKDFLDKNNFEVFNSNRTITTYLTLASILQLDYVVEPDSPIYFDEVIFGHTY